MTININNKKAFTLIEALVAISILMIAIASPMTLVQKSLSTATLSKDQMIAAFLAQDAIEAVKNIRDQIAVISISGTDEDWLVGSGGVSLSPCMCTGDSDDCNFDSASIKFCTIDTADSSVWKTGDIKEYIGDTSYSSAILKINYNNSTNEKTFMKYDYSSSGADYSKFSRYINIKKTGGLDGNEAVVSVRVVWSSPQGIQQNIDVQDFIYNYSVNLQH